jgi:uncharacterized protein (DUF1778 family)
MVRPQKNNTEKRTITLRVRLTLSEKKDIAQAAQNSGLTLSDYARGKLVDAAPRIKQATPERAVFIRALAELGKIGSNLNQVARVLNHRQSGTVNLTALAAQAEEEIAQLSSLLHKILEHGH